MTDRERNILGIATSEGGAVTKSDDFALVSVINQSLTGGSATEWTNKLVEFEYKTDDIPGMINVIFSVTDYFSQPTTAQDYNKLAVDNVKLVYYSRLRSLSFDGAVLESFSPDVYSYALDVDALPADEAEALALVDYELLGGGKSASTAVTYAVTGEHTGAVTVTVTGVDADADGLASHTYTIALAEVPDLGSWTEVFHGTLSIKMGGSEIGGDGQYTVYIVSSTDDPGRCTFSLKDFSLSMDGGESFMYLGDIVVPQVLMTYNDIRPQGAAGPAVSPLYYKGNVDGMELPVRTEPGAEPAGTLTANVGLTGQVAPKVDDQGQPVTDDQGRTVRHAEMNIDVTWLQDPADPSANVPIAVKFAGDRDEQQTTGVEGVSAESGSAPQGPCRYYDLQGRPAAASAAGLLIEVAPDGAARTILRR